MKTESKTPRTDAHLKVRWEKDATANPSAMFTRDLETELNEWKAVAEVFGMVTAEFVNDWVKGDFKLEKLAACDAEAFRGPLEMLTKLRASAESANA